MIGCMIAWMHAKASGTVRTLVNRQYTIKNKQYSIQDLKPRKKHGAGPKPET